MTTSTTASQTNTSVASNLVAKVRKQSSAVAHRKLVRSVMKRAYAIAKNAYNVHNTSIERIAAFGASLSIQEFLKESLSIAWAEHRTGKEIYSVQGKIPRKSMQTIHTALKAKVTEQKNEMYLSQQERYFYQAKTMILSRNAGKFEDDEITLAHFTAFSQTVDAGGQSKHAA